MRPLGLSAAALRHPKSQRRPPPTSLLDVLPTLVCRPCKLLQTSAPASSQALVGGSPRRPTTTAGASTGMLALNHCGVFLPLHHHRSPGLSAPGLSKSRGSKPKSVPNKTSAARASRVTPCHSGACNRHICLLQWGGRFVGRSLSSC